jgi:phosphatidate cytidylyltransferase
MCFSSVLQRFNTTNLRLRMISAAFMAPVALLAVYLGGIAYAAVITAAVTIGLYEWMRIISPKMHPQLIGVACSFLVVVLACGVLISPFGGAVLGLCFTALLFLISKKHCPESSGLIALGLPYMGGSGLALLALRSTPGYGGAAFMFFLLAVVWGMDIGGFGAGCLIGGPKLAPGISPKKTWAGFFGGIVLATILGYSVAALFHARLPGVTLVVAPVLAAVAQLGDLFESYFKRRSGVKESGDLIPGHGGVLDRIDGLVFAGIFAFLFQATFGAEINWW